MYSNLYKHHNYLNKYAEIMIGTDIYEYDMSSAGFNLIKYYKLIPDEKIKKLETRDKKIRQISIGLMCRNDKELKKALNDAFVDMRRKFFEANDIQDNEVLSIKKDAIFVLRPCYMTSFGNVEFVKKNVYSSYIYIDKKEIYYNKDTVHIKGISDDKVKQYHKEYMCDLFATCLRLLESMNEKKLKELLVEFGRMYKERELPVEYYREFNKNSFYRYLDDGRVMFEDIGDVNMIDISYNYLNIIIPLQNILI